MKLRKRKYAISWKRPTEKTRHSPVERLRDRIGIERAFGGTWLQSILRKIEYRFLYLIARFNNQENFNPLAINNFCKLFQMHAEFGGLFWTDHSQSWYRTRKFILNSEFMTSNYFFHIKLHFNDVQLFQVIYFEWIFFGGLGLNVLQVLQKSFRLWLFCPSQHFTSGLIDLAGKGFYKIWSR